MQPVLRADRARRPVGRQRADHRRERHRQGAWSRRRCTRRRRAPASPLVTVNAGGLSEGVFESELFGHVKGAFTDAKADRVGRFELADGGTLFLDEIANMPLGQQAEAAARAARPASSSGSARRARASVDVRMLSATNADLHAEVAAGRFRAGPAVPPEHGRDPRCRRCASGARTSRCWPRTSCASTRSATASRSPASTPRRCRRCSSIAWPGNVRELDHAVERAVLMAQRRRRSRAADLGLRAGRRRPRAGSRT